MTAIAERWPRVGLGCASLGQPDVPDSDAEATIARAIERGIRFFDVAPLYGGGLAEVRLGRALRRSGLDRDDYVLCTKTGVTRGFGQGPIPPGGTRRREGDTWEYSARATRASVATSCERLGVSRLDVVHLHDAENHLDACLEARAALDALRGEGVVGGIGVGSNLPAPVRTLIGRAEFDAFLLAGRYTLLDQSGAPLFELARSKGIRVVAGGVFNSGILGAWPPTSATFDYMPAAGAMLDRVRRIAEICARHDVPLAAAALQFVLRHPAVTTALIGPRTVDELDRNIEALAHPIAGVLWSDLAGAGFIGSEPLATQATADAH